jgi:hypothetical protein
MHKMARSIWHRAATVLSIVLLATAALQARADDHLDVLRIGTMVYTNVTVMTKTSSDIYFKHSFGFGNAKVRDVDRTTLVALGYQLPPDEGETQSVLSQSAQTVMESSAMTNFVADPRVQEAQALLTAQLGDFVEKLTPEVMNGVAAGLIALYLFFCLCCRQICVKSGLKANPLIWLPLFKQIPLLRAARMSPWWLIPGFLLFPIAWPILKIVWAFKIAPARDKHWAVGLLLILPVTNIFAFLYLAFSGTGRGEPTNSSVISLGAPPPRREAA